MAWNCHKASFLTWVMLACLLPMKVGAQIVIIPQEKLDSIAHPQLDPIASALEFDRTVIDAGRINEDDGMQVFEYGFRNVSRETIGIQRLLTNCSCVLALSSHKVVRPGEKASIKVTYLPEGHPGTFERTVRVYADKVLPEKKGRVQDAGKKPLRLAAFLKLKIRVSESKKQKR